MPIITEEELKKDLKSQNLKNLYFLYGEEKYLISFYKDKLVSLSVKDFENSFNFQKFSGDSVEIDTLTESIDALPLMSNHKCVLVENLEIESLNDAQIDSLLNLIADVPEYCTLIFSMTTIDISVKKSTKSKKIIKQCEKFGCVVNFEKRGTLSLEKQLVSWAKKQNVILSNDNANKIIRYCGNDLQNLKNELEKLCAFALNGEITKDIIEKVVTKNLETTVFVLSNAVAAGDYTKAYKQLDILLSQKEEPIAILAVLSSVYIDMYRARTFIENGLKPEELKDYFDYKGKEFRIKNAVNSSRYLSISMLRNAIDLLLQADISLKSAKTEKRIIMEELLTKLFLLYKKERHC